MSMINTGAGSATLESAPYSGQNRSRISWGAVLAGAVVAVATTLLLSLLGAAMGAGSIHALETTSTDLANYGIGAAIWEIINLALSMALGGYVAARLSGTHSHLDGELHGMTMWGVAVLLGSVLFAHAVSGVVGIVGQGAGSVVSRAVGGAGAISGTLAQEVNPQTTIERLQQSLGNNGDPTTMSHEQIGAEIRALVGSGLLNGSLSESDRDRLVGLVAAQSGVTKEEAARRVSRMENDAKARLAPIPFMNGIEASAGGAQGTRGGGRGGPKRSRRCSGAVHGLGSRSARCPGRRLGRHTPQAHSASRGRARPCLAFRGRIRSCHATRNLRHPQHPRDGRTHQRRRL